MSENTYYSEDDSEGELKQRWTHIISYRELILSLSIGLFQIWRFQYIYLETYTFMFLTFYIIFHLCIGYPFLYMELVLGSIRRRTLSKVWDIAPVGRGISYTWLLISLQKAIICVIIGGYTIALSVSIFNNDDGRLPFLLCHGDTKRKCVNRTLAAMKESSSLPSEYYVKEYLTSSTYKGKPHYSLFVGIIVLWVLVLLLARFGIYSYSKMVVFNSGCVGCLLVLFFILSSRSIPGWKGIIRHITTGDLFHKLMPGIKFEKWQMIDCNKIFIKRAVHTIVQAAKQVLSELAIGSGPVVLLGTHNVQSKQLNRTALICCTLSILVSLFASYPLVVTMMSLRHEYGDKVAIQPGPSIFFILWSETVVRMDGNHFWLFFVCISIVCIAAATAALYFLVVVQMTGGSYKSLSCSTIFIFMTCLIVTIVAVWMEPFENTYVVVILDTWSTSTCILIVTTFTALVLSFSHGQTLFCDDVRHAINEYPNTFVRICWTVVPFILIGFFILDCVFSEKLSVLLSIMRKDRKPTQHIYLYNAIGFILIGLTLSPMLVMSIFYTLFSCRTRVIIKFNSLFHRKVNDCYPMLTFKQWGEIDLLSEIKDQLLKPADRE